MFRHKSNTPIQLFVTLTVRKFLEDGNAVRKPVGVDIHRELYTECIGWLIRGM